MGPWIDTCVEEIIVFPMKFRPSLGTVTGGKAKGHGVIIDRVWNYFSDNNSTKPGSQRVVLSEKAPLYFQHDGYSRTIVGVQAKCQSNGIHQYNLLILDPAHRTEALAKSLKQNFGWQKLIKRGIHTLKKLQYQVLPIPVTRVFGLSGVCYIVL